ncbi:MAG: GumC family protein [Rhizomicrobium sp.]
MNDLILDSPNRRVLLDPSFRPNENALTPFRHAIGSLWSNRWLASLVAALIFVLVVGAGLFMPRSHYAEAMLVIHPGHDNFEQPDQQNVLPPDTSAIDTEVEILRSPAIATAVVKKLKLYDDPEFGAHSKGGLGAMLRRAVSAISGNADQDDQSGAADNLIHRATMAFIGRSRIRRIGLTYMVQVGFAAGSAKVAETIANAIVSAYMQQKLDQKLAAVRRANDDLGTTLAGLRQQALDAQARVEEYVAKNGLLTADSATLAEGELSSLSEKVADAQADTAEKLAALAAAQTRPQGGAGADASNTLTDLRQKEADISVTLAQLQTQFGPEYPLVKKNQAELTDIRNEIEAASERVVASLSAEARAAEQKEMALLSSRKAVESRIASNNQARVGLLPLQQAADSTKTIYETYLQRASQVTAERGLQQVDAIIESKAVPGPDSPFSSLRFIALAGVILALAGSVIVVLLTEMWTPRIRSLTDVRRETGMPVVGLLPDASGSTSGAVAFLADNPLTVVAEAFRSLGAFLSMAPQTGMARIIAVTSAVPAEGKTMTSICLARTLAAGGARVLLIDCDLRHPSTPTFFAKPQYGVAEVVLQGVPPDRAIVRDGKSGVWFLAGTGGNDIPTFVFSDSRLDVLLAKLSEQFDHIIIDTPPILGFADARILAAKAGRVLFLVRWNKTPASVVGAAMDVLKLCNARVVGVVLNKVDVGQQAVYGFADGSDYYHHYGSAYPKLS